ncbi:hypothetical protein FRC18_004696 [Serendipita sp. 400]|nr:hypothetical protein FRC18_004696 [Serendipita sp. 400]
MTFFANCLCLPMWTPDLQRLTVGVVEQFIADLKECVEQVKGKPTGKGNMVTLYGLGSSSAVGHTMVAKVASIFLDTMYIA